MRKNITIIENKNVAGVGDRIKRAANLSLAIDNEKRQSQIESIDYAKEKERFLRMHASNSKQTERTYKTALKTLEDYTTMYKLNILDMRSSEADDFVIALKSNRELSANTIRLITAGCSSFFTHLERNFIFMKNPFRGTKTRPRVANKKNTLIPTKKEMDLIISNTKNKTLRTVIIFIKETGVRIGALSSLEIVKVQQGYIYKAHSKGRDVKGLVSTTAIKAIAKAGLNITKSQDVMSAKSDRRLSAYGEDVYDFAKPFAHLNTEVLRVSIYNSIKILQKQKLVNHCYSVHDLRHYFATECYKKDKDIYKLKKLLNHSSISITERYLKSMDIEV